jgi:serine phosphatase RsbU (regulator of sigma subunit)
MALSGFVDKLIYHKDKENPETYQKGKYFVYTTLLFFLLCFSAIPYFGFVQPEEINAHPEFLVMNVICLFLIGILLAIYRKYGQRVLFVNVITFMGWAGNYGTYHTTGGIFSPDNMWGIIISSWVFLVANKKSGIFWFATVLLTICFFFYADVKGYRDFFSDIRPLGSEYFFFNYFLAVVFLWAIISLYEKGKDALMKSISDAKRDLEEKSRELEIRNKDVTDSINYAKKIQYAVLPHEESIYRSIPLSFIYYVPKDIVSGDFFWFHELDRDNFIIVSADCTGHGVPGAFMTVICSSLLNQIVIEDKITKPSEILSELDRRIVMTLKQEKEKTTTVQDGADLSLLKVNKVTKELIISSAKRPAVFVREKSMKDIKGNKFSIGGMRTDIKIFEEVKLDFQEDDMIYFYTDGFTDQFGGDKGKKYSSKRLKETLLSIHHLPVSEQKSKLDTIMKEWKGELDQVDDILVMGIKL